MNAAPVVRRRLRDEELRHAKRTMPSRALADREAFLVWALRWAEDALDSALECRAANGPRGERYLALRELERAVRAGEPVTPALEALDALRKRPS